MVATLRPTGDLNALAFQGIQALGVAFAYYVGTKISVLTTPIGLPVTSLWISAGVALFCLLTFGIRVWPGITLGSLVSNLAAVPPPEALLVSLGNTIAPLCAYLLLRHVGFRLEMDRIRDALSFVLLGAFGAMALSASVGTMALVAAGLWPPTRFLQMWMVWWSSDVLGVLVVTPLLLVLRRFREVTQVRWWRLLEFAALLSTTLVITLAGTRNFGEIFLAFPLVVLAAMRFQLNGVAPCALIVSAVAIDSVGHAYGRFEGRGLLTNVMILQVFNGTLVLTGLLLAVVITQWRQARAEIERTYLKLAEVVERLHQSMLPDAAYVQGLRNNAHASGRLRNDYPARDS